MVTVQNLFVVFFFCLLFIVEGTLQPKKVLQLTKKENLSKSQYRYRSIIKIVLLSFSPNCPLTTSQFTAEASIVQMRGGYSIALRCCNCDPRGLKIPCGPSSPFHTETEHTENHTSLKRRREGGVNTTSTCSHNVYPNGSHVGRAAPPPSFSPPLPRVLSRHSGLCLHFSNTQ